MYLPNRDYDIRSAQDFITIQLGSAQANDQFGNQFRMWRPDDEPVVRAAVANLPMEELLEAQCASRYLRNRVALYPVEDPVAVVLAERLGQPFSVDPDGSFDQLHSAVQIEARTNRAFGKYWKHVGRILAMPEDATTQEIGFTVISRYPFSIVRAAFTTINQTEKRRQRKPYKPIFPDSGSIPIV